MYSLQKNPCWSFSWQNVTPPPSLRTSRIFGVGNHTRSRCLLFWCIRTGGIDIQTILWQVRFKITFMKVSVVSGNQHLCDEKGLLNYPKTKKEGLTRCHPFMPQPFPSNLFFLVLYRLCKTLLYHPCNCLNEASNGACTVLGWYTHYFS